MSSKTYLVSGNNLFNQWLYRQPVIEKFKTLPEAESDESNDFSIEKANLIKICWSYNVFQYKDGFYVTGAWGDNEKDVIKLDMFENLPSSLSDLLVVANDLHIYIIDPKDLKIWTLNVGDISKVSPLQLRFECPLLDESEKPEISKVVLTNKSIFFLTKNGHIFHGIQPVILDTSHCLGEVCDIVSGYDHCILLTTTGYVYTWGSGRKLQLGHGDITNLNTPKQVDALAGLKIIKIAAGAFHSIALSEFGDIYAWGWNKEGQLGVWGDFLGFNKDELVPGCNGLPRLVNMYDIIGCPVMSIIVDVACGSRHTMVKMENNTVWATGYNKYGQLGLAPKNFRKLKHFKKILDIDSNSKLVCGTWTTVLVKDH